MDIDNHNRPTICRRISRKGRTRARTMMRTAKD
jgi:hypothetical protein